MGKFDVLYAPLLCNQTAGVINQLEDGTIYHVSNQYKIFISSMLLHHLSEVNSKSVDTEGLILKSCSKEVVYSMSTVSLIIQCYEINFSELRVL